MDHIKSFNALFEGASNLTPLTDIVEGKADASNSWPDISFHDRNLFNDYMDALDGIVGDRMLKIAPENQESYLGFIPSVDKSNPILDDNDYDVFVTGSDAWGERSNFSGLVFFKLNHGVPTVIEDYKHQGKMMYGSGGGLDYLREHFPNIIDLRLD
jgi:hypothetical protein